MNKLRILLCGALGAMGKNVIECAADFDDLQIKYGFDIENCEVGGLRVYSDINEIPSDDVDVVLDFSHNSVTDSITSWCLTQKKPLVSAVTGITEESEEKIKCASKEIPIFRTSNFSLGISVIKNLAASAASLLGDGYDIEIVEMHHNKKADAPSGTANMLLESVSESLPYEPNVVYGRAPSDGKRKKNDIGMHSVRGGGICGEHEVMFISEGEIISIKHSALSKRVFALGALKAVRYISEKEKGLYDMDGMINGK